MHNIFPASEQVESGIDGLDFGTILYPSDQLAFPNLDPTLQSHMSLEIPRRTSDSSDWSISHTGGTLPMSSANSPNFVWTTCTDLNKREDTVNHTRREQMLSNIRRETRQISKTRPAGNPSITDDPDMQRDGSLLASQRGLRETISNPIDHSLDTNSTEMSKQHKAFEDRICKVISSARSTGFESLDSMMGQYYTTTFENNAPLLEVQSRSRRRGLPGLMSQISNAGASWPQREAQGFQEALLEFVEQIIKKEAREYAASEEIAPVSGPENLQSGSTSLRSDVRSPIGVI